MAIGSVTEVSEEFADSILDYLQMVATKASITSVTPNLPKRHHNPRKYGSSISIISFWNDMNSVGICDNFSHSRS
jgi:hypothetical protein